MIINVIASVWDRYRDRPMILVELVYDCVRLGRQAVSWIYASKYLTLVWCIPPKRITCR